VARPPCIVCGRARRRGHDVEEHERQRAKRRRVVNLLDKRWPALQGVAAVLGWYARREPARPALEPVKRVAWGCKVLPGGRVVHLPIADEGDSADATA
jgi:hypothetical protein